MSAAVERRVAPRFAVKCTGELASGTGLRDVSISDISVTGCGIELADASDQGVDATGVLSIQAAEGTTGPVMLPVVVSNHRLDGDRARLGLKFRRLSLQQMRTLIEVMDGIISK